MNDTAYLAGVIKGDGFCTNYDFGLLAKDADFVQAFADAINNLFGLSVKPRQETRGYWIVRISNKNNRFSHLLHYIPDSPATYGAWIRGLFDGDGNTQLLRLAGNSYQRRIAIYSSYIETLNTAAAYLSELSIPTLLNPTKNSSSHLGTKTVYELRVRSSKTNYIRFAELVGSTIKRKRVVINAIPASYKPDLSQHCRDIQLKGAKTRRERTMNVTLPKVVDGVRELIQEGIKPTQQNCRSIKGFNSIQKYIRQKDLVRMALDD